MFLEYITQEDVKEFIQLYYYNACIKKVAKAREKFNKTHELADEHSIWIEELTAESWNPERITKYIQNNSSIEVYISGAMGRNCTFTDFDFITSGIIRMKSKMHDKDWLNFMYSKMCKLGIGEEYKSAFTKCREKEKEELIKATLKAIKAFDEDTDSYLL